MADFLQYIYDEVKNKRLNKKDAIDLICQFQTQIVANKPSILHPLLHQNTSDLTRQRFSTTLIGDEFFLADHVIKGQRVLPGVAYLEMARAAIASVSGKDLEKSAVIRLKNIVWLRPIVVGEQPFEVNIELYPEENGEIAYEIYSKSDNDEIEIIYNQGSSALTSVKEIPTVDLQAWRSEINQVKLTSEQLYRMYQETGVQYGPGHRGVEAVYIGEGRILAKLTMPASVLETQVDYVLHPSIMDSAVQALIGMSVESGSEQNSKPSLPFALEELEIYSGCTTEMWVLIRSRESGKAGDRIQKHDIDLCDPDGNVCVRMKGYTTRLLDGQIGQVGSTATTGSLMLEKIWQEIAFSKDQQESEKYQQHIVILCEQNEISPKAIEAELPGVRFLYLQSIQEAIDIRFQAYAVQIFETIQIILQGKPKGKVLIQVVTSNQGEGELFAGFSGLLKTAGYENPKLIGQLIEIEPQEEETGIIAILRENSYRPMDSHIRYQDGTRRVAVWSEIKISPTTACIPWKDQGVYLISGGVGGLGIIFAEEIVTQVKNSTVILIGRSPLNAEKQAKLKKLAAQGVRIEYRQVDVCDKKAVNGLIENIQAEFGSLNGIIHSAGVIRDNYIIKKTTEELETVLAPKVGGLVNLDQASKELKLDFFVLFSSIASQGSSGQSDYAMANAFMNTYAGYRNTLAASKERYGRTIAIMWSLWQDGGMHVDAATEKMITQSTGMIPLLTQSGIGAFYQCVAIDKNQMMVLEGNVNQLRTVFSAEPSEMEKPESLTGTLTKEVVEMNAEGLQEKAETYLKKLLSTALKLPVSQIEAEAPMEKYGLDSILVIELTNELEKVFGSLSKTLFFEYQTIQELTRYFLESYRDKLIEILGIGTKIRPSIENNLVNARESEPVKITAINNQRRSRFAVGNQVPMGKTSEVSDIAIIGLSGRYPQADNIEDFWQNLRDGKDCISEIPKERWDKELLFDEDRNKPGKIYCKWGGFLKDIELFDPLFFNISPNEAVMMDPMERLFLETVWNLLESAGYTREAIQRLYQSKVGVFVGAMYQQYRSIDSDIINESIISISTYSSIANRVSHYFNFYGPSIAVDTMCSSSIVAIHMACESLLKGETKIAIAGGVNLSINHKKYLGLSLAQIVASRLNSRSFGDGDGYIPAEGVGAVLLKPLAQAIKDQDTILAVIKSTATNHGGHTNGFSVPNPNAQEQLICDNFAKSEIDPRTISYIESAASGSPFGDSIEVTALTKAFRKFTQDQQFCVIGSVKSNIGHAEAASGISQLTKVVLQLQHQQIVPTIYAEPINPNINFDNTPFYIQRELKEWKRPLIRNGEQEREFPRRATVSAFGAGGSNAHLIIEEYIPAINVTSRDTSIIQPQVVVFSAKNQERLPVIIQQMREFIQCHPEITLPDFAYTLQSGREEMAARLAIVANTLEDLIQGMNEYLKSVLENKDIETSIPVFTGNLEEESSEVRTLLSGKVGETVLQLLLADRNLEKLALHWVKGGKIPWEMLHQGESVRKISLPTYPFKKERYWISNIKIEEHQAEVFQETAGRSEKITFVSNKSAQENIQDYILQFISQELNIAPDQIKLNRNIHEYGANSIMIMKMMRGFEKHFHFKIKGREILEYPTIKSLSDYVAKKIEGMNYQEMLIKAQAETKSPPKDVKREIDNEIVEALEKFSQGTIDLTEIQNLLEVK